MHLRRNGTSRARGWKGPLTAGLSLILSTAAVAGEKVMEGELSDTNLVMPTDGSFYAVHEFTAQAGDEITIDLMSEDFDSYLLVHSPSGGIHQDDDGGEGYNSRLSITADEAGTWKVFANTVGRGETGRYTLQIRSIDAREFQTQTFSGSLDPSSPKRPDNNTPYHEHTVQLAAGQEIIVGMTSEDFDAMLFVHSPSGQSFHDDDGGEGTNARLSLTADAAGAWRIVATAYGADAAGSYTLTLRTRNTNVRIP